MVVPGQPVAGQKVAPSRLDGTADASRRNASRGADEARGAEAFRKAYANREGEDTSRPEPSQTGSNSPSKDAKTSVGDGAGEDDGEAQAHGAGAAASTVEDDGKQITSRADPSGAQPETALMRAPDNMPPQANAYGLAVSRSETRSEGVIATPPMGEGQAPGNATSGRLPPNVATASSKAQDPTSETPAKDADAKAQVATQTRITRADDNSGHGAVLAGARSETKAHTNGALASPAASPKSRSVAEDLAGVVARDGAGNGRAYSEDVTGSAKTGRGVAPPAGAGDDVASPSGLPGAKGGTELAAAADASSARQKDLGGHPGALEPLRASAAGSAARTSADQRPDGAMTAAQIRADHAASPALAATAAASEEGASLRKRARERASEDLAPRLGPDSRSREDTPRSQVALAATATLQDRALARPAAASVGQAFGLSEALAGTISDPGAETGGGGPTSITAIGTSASGQAGSLFGHGHAPAMAQNAAGQIVASLPRPMSDLGNGTLEVSLDPPELGRVRLSLIEVAGTMTLSITAERPETAELMRRHLDLLAQEFARAGLDAPNVRIGGENGSAGAQDKGGGASGGAAGSHADLAEPEKGQPTTVATAPDQNRALDLRL